MTEKFSIAFSREFISDSGELTFGDIGLHLLNQSPRIFYSFLEEFHEIVVADQLKNIDGLVIHDPYISSQTFNSETNRLLVIARMGAGYDRIDIGACTAAGVAVINAPDAMRMPTASAALMFLLVLSKRLCDLDQLVRKGQWEKKREERGIDLPGKTLGVIGMGAIGRELVRLVRPLNMRIIAYDPYIDPYEIGDLNCTLVSLDRLLIESDFISLHCRLNEETRGLIGRREFDLMKPSAYIINLARGPVIDHNALIDALSKHKIAGAGLDVFYLEPLPPDDPIIKFKNVVLTPHGAANTQDALTNSGISVLKGILQISNGKLPNNIVNKEVVNNKEFQSKLSRFSSEVFVDPKSI